MHLPVTLCSCRLPAVDASALVFPVPVTFERCHADATLFSAASFLQGVRFEACTFGGDVTWERGSHNEAPTAFTLLDCMFQGFVNVFDNWSPAVGKQQCP